MFQPNGSTIECDTCVASNTSACGECIVSYVLANDAGPIEYVPSAAPVELRATPVPSPPGAAPLDPCARAAVELFVRAGLVDVPVRFVSAAEFERGSLGEPVGGVLVP